MTQQKITILGINGHVGHHAAKAFVAAGWDVTGFGRSNRHPVPGVRFVQGDADSVADMRAAIGDSEVVFNGLNLPYPDWFEGRMEALYARVLEAMGQGRTMLFPGNIYNFAARDRLLTPGLEQNAETPRGAVRVRVERMLEEAARRGDVQVIILRAGDFYGPESTDDWFSYVIMREVAKGKVAIPGAKGVGHAWAYLPDLGRAFERLAARRGEFGAHEIFHFAGNFVTPEELGTAIAAAAPVPVKVSAFPWFLITLMGLANPLMREIGRMGYLWQHPMALSDPRLDEILGPGFGTPFADAIRETVAPFFSRAAA